MTLGILGGGQLGRMLALAAHPLGIRSVFVDPSPDAAMTAVAEPITARWDDPAALSGLASRADCATWEFENIPVDAVRGLARQMSIYPPIEALDVKRDRLIEKEFLAGLGISLAPFAAAANPAELHEAFRRIGFPCVVKTRRHGYDGKGQLALTTPADPEFVWNQLERLPLVVEQMIPFDRELAILATRSRSGEVRIYDLIETRQFEGILRTAEAPAAEGEGLRADAEEMIHRILRRLDYVGTLALELFQVGNRLIANEMAPRVHNSGHWTIEGTPTSQFENHIRAVMDLPLGSTKATGMSLLVNLIGEIPPLAGILAIPGAHLHLYGKEPRPRRKLGHVTFCGPDREVLRQAAGRLQALIGA